MHVLVKGNLIETVSDEPLAVIQTDNVTMIDGGGRTLMPGLIEAHGHIMFASDLPKLMNQDEFEQGVYAARRANDYLMNGFTTVRDAGSNVLELNEHWMQILLLAREFTQSGVSIRRTSGHGDFRSNVDGHPYFDGKKNGGHVNQWGILRLPMVPMRVRRAVREQLFADITNQNPILGRRNQLHRSSDGGAVRRGDKSRGG